MPTQLKSETARANGAKSQGPKTAQGREISSRNSTKHGLSSRNLLVLECENADDFQAVHDSQMEIHQPATPAEKDLVDQMIAARWRILRLQSIESSLLDTEMRSKKRIERKLGSSHVVKLSEAYTSQANNSRAMALASRHESRLTRMYQSSYKVLRDLQAVRMKQSTQPAPPAETQPANQPAAKPSTRQPVEKICDIEPSGPVVSGASDADRDIGGIPERNKVDYDVAVPVPFS